MFSSRQSVARTRHPRTTRCALIRFDRGECPPEWNKPGMRVNLSTDPFMTTAARTEGDHKGCVALAPAP